MLVRRVWSEPSAFITYISQFPSRLDSNAMREGDVGLSADVAVGIGVEVGMDVVVDGWVVSQECAYREVLEPGGLAFDTITRNLCVTNHVLRGLLQ